MQPYVRIVVSLFNLLLYVLTTICFTYVLVDLTTSDLRQAFTLATTAHPFHI